MSLSQGPTPCPQPRFPQRHASTKLATLTEESAPTPPCRQQQNLLRGAKPRRPGRKARASAVWDPTVDIYDDTFAFKADVPAPGGPAQSVASEQSLHGTGYAQSLNRRNSLWAQPAQRLPLDADIKRRRVSGVPDPLNEGVSAQGQTVLNSISENAKKPAAQPFLSKDPRRRTIYVPSDDTTVMTIHPGQSLRESNNGPRRPRRSDMFLNLGATMQQGDNEQTLEIKSVHKPPRKSLCVAPRKAPLQPAPRAYQPNSPHRDVAGTGGGKENVPPGREQEYNCKPDDDNTCLLKASARRVSISQSKDKVASPKRRFSAAVNQRQEPLAAKDANSPGKVITNRSSLNQQGLTTNIKQPTEVQAPSTAGQHSSLQKRVSLGSSLTSARSFITDKQPPSKLSVPLLSQSIRRATSIYPTISEHVPHSEMYEDSWLANQEAAISELINRLFESAGSSINNSPLPETASTLRKQLISLYHDPTLVLLHKRLKASLQFGALGISRETLTHVCRFKDDMQQRQRFLDLWIKTYNLKSLQTVVEVVVGREMPLNPRLSNSPPPRVHASDSNVPRNRRLEAYLKSFLVRNEDGLQKSINSSLNNTPFNNYEDDAVDDTGSNGWLWRRTVIRSLMVILLLDQAQKAGLFKECLFQPTSPFKSSSAVVQALGNLLLPSIGNIYRVLEHLSYHVHHVQYPLEEQKYHVNNLAVDLRDGVLLTRLVEVLLYPPSSLDLDSNNVTVTLPCGNVLTSTTGEPNQQQLWPLSQRLKFPCVSRVQKLYNVQIALSALSGVKDFEATLSSITPEDIVDGHRERNVGLLWSIVGRWGLSVLVDFDLVEREITRLDKCWKQMNLPNGMSLSTDGDNNDETDDPALEYSTGLERHTILLRTWVQKVARLHNVKVLNLSTSFADGKAYKAIIAEYAKHIDSSLPPSSPSSLKNTLSSSIGSSASVTETLTRLGCSRSFISLFRNTSIPSSQTTIPLLAFLVSRFLPASRPVFAAITIQRVWRRAQMRWNLRRRVTLAVLARDCATVVTARERIVNAAMAIQRWWRKVDSRYA